MSEAKPRTLFDKIWDSHVVETAPGRDLHPLHRPPPAARGHQPAGVRGPAPGRPQAAPARSDDRGRRPQHPDRRRAHAGRHQGRGQPHPGRDAGEERRRVRRALHPDPRCAAGHRAHHRPGTGHQPAGHDDRLRRQPHLHAWRDGRAGVRHRHLRGRARDGDADAAAAAGEEHAGAGRRHPAASAARPRTSCWRSSARSAPPAATGT